MTVYDRWHLSHPPADAAPCRCSRGRAKLYPNPDTHEKGKRWQVRWDVIDPDTGKRRQPRRNFAKKDGADPNTCAEAFDALITSQVNSGTYTDPDAGKKPFETYAEEVLADRVLTHNTRTEMRARLAKHVYPVIGDKALRVLSRRPTLIANLVSRLEAAELSARSVNLIIANVSTVFACALEDELITRNPVKSKAVRLPPDRRQKVTPWTAEQVAAMRGALPARFAAMVDVGAGLGLRQGEIFGLSPDDIEWLGKDPVVHVRRQVLVVKPSGLVLALPKGGKTRTVPLPESVKWTLSDHLENYPAASVTLPWETRDGKAVTVPLLFTVAAGRAVQRSYFNDEMWRPALVKAGIVKPPKKGETLGPLRGYGMHQLRHFFASSLLTEGEAIQAVSEWLGHYDPVITLSTYAHLMPKSQTRMRKLIDAALDPAAEDAPSKLPRQR